MSPYCGFPVVLFLNLDLFVLFASAKLNYFEFPCCATSIVHCERVFFHLLLSREGR